MIQAVMANQDTTRQDGDVCAPLKSELQRDLKKAMASNSKYVASIESLKKKKNTTEYYIIAKEESEVASGIPQQTPRGKEDF